jgi:hypothetical protein
MVEMTISRFVGWAASNKCDYDRRGNAGHEIPFNCWCSAGANLALRKNVATPSQSRESISGFPIRSTKGILPCP